MSRPRGFGGLSVAAAMVALAGCGPGSGHGADERHDDNERFDAGVADAAPVDAPADPPYADASIAFDGKAACEDWRCPTPVDDGCRPGTADICGNGLDDNCDTEVDEGCGCQPGAVQACFAGQPGRRGIGGCVDGTQTCQGGGEFSWWGPCVGGLSPSPEACDSVDNNCNGCVDDHPACCDVLLQCPGNLEGEPFQSYVINGASFYGGAVTSWTWTVVGGPCDDLLQATSGRTSFTLTGADTSALTFHPRLSGDYTIQVTIVAADGTTYTCTFVFHIRGPGMRIEMCSDRTANTDLDLHLHRPLGAGVREGWFAAGGTDVCYYGNCKAASIAPPAWGYVNSSLAECVGGPEGAMWTALGYCRNPRLDIDSIRQAGVPENINVDVPQHGGKYRVMVNYFSGAGDAHPVVNVYCGGHLRASYGLPGAATQVTGFDTSGFDNTGDMWRVVDVVPTLVGGVTLDCALEPIHPPGQDSGYYVADQPRTF